MHIHIEANRTDSIKQDVLASAIKEKECTVRSLPNSTFISIDMLKKMCSVTSFQFPEQLYLFFYDKFQLQHFCVASYVNFFENGCVNLRKKNCHYTYYTYDFTVSITGNSVLC
jgi:tRNA splicing ligase